MSDVIKWGILTVGFAAIIALILAFPISSALGLASSSFSESVRYVVTYSGEGLYIARSLINTFLMSPGRKLLSGLIYWIFFKWIYTVSVKILIIAYKWIFK